MYAHNLFLLLDVEAQLQGPAPGNKTAFSPPNPPLRTPGTTSSVANLSETLQQDTQAPHATAQSPVPITDDVVDQILQRVAERIDRPGVHVGHDDAPPMYPS